MKRPRPTIRMLPPVGKPDPARALPLLLALLKEQVRREASGTVLKELRERVRKLDE